MRHHDSIVLDHLQSQLNDLIDASMGICYEIPSPSYEVPFVGREGLMDRRTLKGYEAEEEIYTCGQGDGVEA